MQEEFEGFNKRQRENREVVDPTILSYLIEGILNELRTEETVASYATQQSEPTDLTVLRSPWDTWSAAPMVSCYVVPGTHGQPVLLLP